MLESERERSERGVRRQSIVIFGAKSRVDWSFCDVTSS